MTSAKSGGGNTTWVAMQQASKQGVGHASARHLNFHQISHRFARSFANPSFQDLNGSHIMYWNMITLNPLRFKVEPHSKYWYFCFEVETYFHYASRKTPCYITLNGCVEKPKCKLATISLHFGDSLSLSCIVCLQAMFSMVPSLNIRSVVWFSAWTQLCILHDTFLHNACAYAICPPCLANCTIWVNWNWNWNSFLTPRKRTLEKGPFIQHSPVSWLVSGNL